MIFFSSFYILTYRFSVSFLGKLDTWKWQGLFKSHFQFFAQVFAKLEFQLRTAFILRLDFVHSVVRRSISRKCTLTPLLLGNHILARSGMRHAQPFSVRIRNPGGTGKSPNHPTSRLVQTSPKFVWPVVTAWCRAACCPASSVSQTRQRIENWDRFVNWRFWNEEVQIITQSKGYDIDFMIGCD